MSDAMGQIREDLESCISHIHSLREEVWECKSMLILLIRGGADVAGGTPNRVFESALQHECAGALVSHFASHATWDDFNPYPACASNMGALCYAMFYHDDPRVLLRLLGCVSSDCINQAFENYKHVRSTWARMLAWADDASIGSYASQGGEGTWHAFLQKLDPVHLQITDADGYGLTALHVYSRASDAPVVQLLLGHMLREHILLEDAWGHTALHHAACASKDIATVFASHPRVGAEHFLARTSGTFKGTTRGSTPLMKAVEMHMPATATVLLHWQIWKSVGSFIRLRSTCSYLRHEFSPGTRRVHEGGGAFTNDLHGDIWGNIARLACRGEILALRRDLASTTNEDGDSVHGVLQLQQGEVGGTLGPEWGAFVSMLRNPERSFGAAWVFATVHDSRGAMA